MHTAKKLTVSIKYILIKEEDDMSMRLKRIMKSGVALLMALTMILSFNVNVKAAKKASIYSGWTNIKLQYSKYGDNSYIPGCYQGLESIIKNPNKKATYSVKVKNTKVAKVVKNKNYKSKLRYI